MWLLKRRSKHARHADFRKDPLLDWENAQIKNRELFLQLLLSAEMEPAEMASFRSSCPTWRERDTALFQARFDSGLSALHPQASPSSDWFNEYSGQDAPKKRITILHDLIAERQEELLQSGQRGEFFSDPVVQFLQLKAASLEQTARKKLTEIRAKADQLIS